MFRKLSLILLALLFATSPAFAEGFYGGAGVGLVQIEDEEEGESFEDNPIGWKLFVGYEFNENFALEGAYMNSGEAEDQFFGENVKAELTAFTGSLIGLYPVSDTVQIFGKLGFFSGEQEISVLGITVDEDDDGMTLGAGFRFKTSDRLSIRADFDWFDADVDTLWSIGIAFQLHFGQ